MGRHAHDGAGSVIGQYIVGKPDGKLCAVHGIDRIASGKYAGFFLILNAIYVGAHGGAENVVLHGLSCLIGCQILCNGMLRSQYHKGCAVEGIGTCGVYGNLFLTAFYRELYLRAVGFADPVGLHLLYLFRPVQLVQIV